MINSYKQNKDLYADIASRIYHNKYEDNREFFPDGTINPEGKKRRTSVKSLLLGIMYGMGPASLAESIHGTIQDAQGIIDTFYRQYPKVKKWIDQSAIDARKNGYVEDPWGRRRRLPDIQRPKFEIILEQSSTQFNPLLFSKNVYDNNATAKIEAYRKKAEKCRNKNDIEALKREAAKNGITIHDNGGFIARAERQCVNARIQGGAATMSKKAMIAVHHDEELKRLGFRLLIVVHDELIGECPIENAEAVRDRLSYCMIHAGEPECKTPMKCDADSFHAWYEDVYGAEVKEEYDDLLKKGLTSETAFDIILKNHSECTEEKLKKFID